MGILVDMATLRVRWEKGDYSNFVVTQAQILNSTLTPFWWIMTMCAMALIFLAPQFISRFVVRCIPEYADSLRNLLLLTIERSSALEGLNNQVKTVGISLRPKDNETDLVALLSVNECIVTAMKKPTGFERRSTDERTTSIDESPKHSEGSLPFL